MSDAESAAHPPRSATGLSALAASIRRAVVDAGEAAYEDAGIQGLCAEGRWEAAVAAMRAVDVEAIIRRAPENGNVAEPVAAEADPHPSANC